MIYFIQAGKRVKVGYTDNVPRRLAQLQTGSSELLSVLGTINGEMHLERALHDLMQQYRAQGEWFEYRGKVRQFVKLVTGGARPNGLVDLCNLWDFADHPSRVEAARATINNPESSHDELREAHILLRDLTR